MIIRKRNVVQTFIRNIIRWGIAIPAWIYLAWPIFKRLNFESSSGPFANVSFGQIFLGLIYTLIILWGSNVVAKIFHILPEWERLVLLRLGKSVGEKGPGFFLIPPFIYEIARVIDVRIMTYEVKATRTLTKDNVPIDVTAAIEFEVENPEKAAIGVKDYWKTTEWASMEALKSSIGKNDLRTLLSETEAIATSVKREIDEAAKDFGVNVRAVRITDIGAPPALIEELAVIARAERSSKAKQIQAEAEKAVAVQLADASQIMSSQTHAMQLRQIQALLEMSKEESATIIIYPMDSLTGERIASATAGSKSTTLGKTPPLTPPEA